MFEMFPVAASMVRQLRSEAPPLPWPPVKSAYAVTVEFAEGGGKCTGSRRFWWWSVVVVGVAVLSRSLCHGCAGSQQPTEPTEQPTVHCGQHRAGKP
jgi:hypothetical protein